MATKEQLENEVENLKEKFELLKGKVDLMEILVKNPPKTISSDKVRDVKNITQINVKPKTETITKKEGGRTYTETRVVDKGKSFFCESPDDVRIFEENHPGVETESFKVELETATADRYLNDPENRKAFEKEAING